MTLESAIARYGRADAVKCVFLFVGRARTELGFLSKCSDESPGR
jgi:hypothetical protein